MNSTHFTPSLKCRTAKISLLFYSEARLMCFCFCFLPKTCEYFIFSCFFWTLDSVWMDLMSDALNIQGPFSYHYSTWYSKYGLRTLTFISLVIGYPPVPGCTQQGHQRDPAAYCWGSETGCSPAQPRGMEGDKGRGKGKLWKKLCLCVSVCCATCQMPSNSQWLYS